MAQDFGVPTPAPQIAPPPQNRNTIIWIIVIVAAVIVLLFCCCVLVGLLVLVYNGKSIQTSSGSILALLSMLV